MANQEHLDILRKGVEVWNQWCKEQTDILPDLSGADLSEIDLGGAYLKEANLSHTNLKEANLAAFLSYANLSHANLSAAFLSYANLSHANLSHANLSHANLKEANLSHANLKEANLNEASLNGANLNEASLNGANLWEANLYKADLCRADLSMDPYRIDRWGGLVISILYHADLREASLNEANLWYANLSHADLRRAHLTGANLTGADLSHASLNRAYLHQADLSRADLSHASLNEAYLHQADLSRADLREASLNGANLYKANLGEANLYKANLGGAILVETNLTDATLTNCTVYGISAWNVQLEGAKQDSLIITRDDEPTITVDNLEVAQFIYLLLNNQKIRQTIDTITSQVVLVLGSFPSERKEVIDALSTELRSQKYSPVIFNFEGTENKDFTATARTLANMARFVLLDLTDLDDAIREIADVIVPHCIVPIRPLLLQGSHRQEYELFRELQRKYRWVVAPYRYNDLPDLRSNFQEKVLQPIHEKLIELKQKKPLKMFLGYAPEDKNTLKTLKTHLRPLERAGLIEVWDDQDVAPGEEKGKEIERHLSEARIILLLISPAFLSSHDCSDIQMSMALERYEQAEARVIPILLRPCAWQSTPLKGLQPLPRDGEPISRHNKDEVFFEVSEEIAEVIKSLG